MSEGFAESFQNSGVMRNNEYYSIEVEPKHETPIPLRDILHKEPVMIDISFQVILINGSI
jgi:hypothetical protein